MARTSDRRSPRDRAVGAAAAPAPRAGARCWTEGKKIESVRARGEDLACRVCGFDYERTYGVRGAGYIECHHAVPLHVTGRRTTRLDDLILICANCHRMIHRGPGWLSPSELRDCLAHAT